MAVHAATTDTALNWFVFSVTRTLPGSPLFPYTTLFRSCASIGNANDVMAYVRFTDASKGYSTSAPVTCGSNFAFSTTLPPGTYDVRIDRDSSRLTSSH